MRALYRKTLLPSPSTLGRRVAGAPAPGGRRARVLVLAALVAAVLPAPSAVADPLAPAQARSGLLKGVGFDQNLNTQLPLDLTFRDESGRDVRLGAFFGKKPVILNLVYYECPMLCTLSLNELVQSLKPVSFDIGKEFTIVTVSIAPSETPALAAAKKKRYLERYGRPGADQGWHFLTGDETSIRRLAGVVGFHYVYDASSGQYAHPAGLMIVTPEGRISRYLYGINYPARDLRLSLMEASSGKIGSPVDKLLLLCFHYDPATGKYNFAIMNVIRFLGALTVLVLGSFMFVMFRRDRRKVPALAADHG